MGPSFFRRATMRPVNPAKAMLISAIVCNDSGVSIIVNGTKNVIAIPLLSHVH